MGTSVNQGSPRVPSWGIVRALLGQVGTPREQQVQEIWRAALSDRGGILRTELSSPAVAAGVEIAASAGTPQQALAIFNQNASESRRADFAIELARRALVRSVAANAGAEGYASELMAEVTSYYASRDLPGFVGIHGRVQTVRAAAELKDGLREVARSGAADAAPPSGAKGWPGYVNRVTNLLAKTGSR